MSDETRQTLALGKLYCLCSHGGSYAHALVLALIYAPHNFDAVTEVLS